MQIIKGDPKKGGTLEFGTEIIRSADGSLTALLGASPGASTAVAIMLDLIAKSLSVVNVGDDQLRAIVPTYGVPIHTDAALAARVLEETSRSLQLR